MNKIILIGIVLLVFGIIYFLSVEKNTKIANFDDQDTTSTQEPYSPASHSNDAPLEINNAESKAQAKSDFDKENRLTDEEISEKLEKHSLEVQSIELDEEGNKIYTLTGKETEYTHTDWSEEQEQEVLKTINKREIELDQTDMAAIEAWRNKEN